MEFRILGPLEAVGETGAVLPLGGARQRALLAALLLHANEVVLSDQLIDELWGENPPATRAKALQVAVSQLRKTLGDGVVQTRGAGYLFRVAPDQLDSTRFEALRDEARARLAEGRPEQAAAALREALALWRGPALADVAYESFARAEVERLEELRLVALEERIEADLACARHAELVAELEALVRKHPFRERLRVLLMLALYRSGRQAEALDVYRDVRRLLADELGIDPSSELQEVERAILRQAPELSAIRPATPAAPFELARGRRALVAVALLAAVAVLGLVVAFRGGARVIHSVPPNSVAVIDPARNAVADAITVDDSPGPLARGGGSVWVLNRNSRTITEIDPRRRRPTYTLGIGGSPTGLAADRDGFFEVDAETATLVFDDPQTRIETGLVLQKQKRLAANDVVVDGDHVWVASLDAPELFRASITGVGSSLRVFALPRPASAVALDDTFLWVALDDGTLARLDALKGDVAARVRVGEHPSDVAVAFGSVWVANADDGTVSRIRRESAASAARIRVGRDPSSIAAGAGAVWVVNRGDGTLSRIDPRTNRVAATIRVGQRPEAVVVAGGLVWVSVRAKRAWPGTT